MGLKGLTKADKDSIRKRREKECFSIVNRGPLWYNTLTFEQKRDLDRWYRAWLNAPETGYVPNTPKFINSKVSEEEEII